MNNEKQLPEGLEQSTDDSKQDIKKVDQLNASEKEKQISKIQIHEYSGPIPHPNILKGYNEIHPDLVKNIMDKADKEQNFRHKSIMFGQISAIIIGISGLISTTALGIYGHPWLAGCIGFLSLGSLVAKFFYKSDM